MYEKFGEFDSADEINRAADAQKAEGDELAVLAIAKENGIDEDDARDYLAGDLPTLCTPISAAIGKIELEAGELQIFGPFEDWKEMLLEMVTEEKELAAGVRRKGKSLCECFGKLVYEESRNRKNADSRILKASGISLNTLPVSTMSRIQQRDFMRAYYGGAS